MASAGVLLGRMHRVLRGYGPPTAARWPVETDTSGLADAVSRLGRSPETEVARRVLPLFLRFVAPPTGDRTPRHVVHNDFAWYNCTRVGRRIDGIFDWDAASVATELRDVAYAVYAFAPIGPQRALGQTETRIAEKVTNATMLIWRVLRVGEQRFRRLDAPELLADVYDGRRFADGMPITRASGKVA